MLDWRNEILDKAMNIFKEKVAVITGGASGLGYAMASRFLKEGMRLVIADIEEPRLQSAVRQLRDAGGKVLGVACDVSQGSDVENLAQKTLEEFGGCHIICNNAGVAPSGVIWEHTTEDWQWAMGPNVWGVIHGIRVFTPILIEQNEPAHIVNTASVSGLLSFAGMGLYCMTKHAVVTMTECLKHDLSLATELVKCSVLCPAYVPTQIAESERNRPKNLVGNRTKTDEDIARENNLRKAVSSGKISAEAVADLVLKAIIDEKFYILPHEKIKGAIESRMQDILEDRTPLDTSR